MGSRDALLKGQQPADGQEIGPGEQSRGGSAESLCTAAAFHTS